MNKALVPLTKEGSINSDLEKTLKNVEMSKESTWEVMVGDLIFGDVCLKANLFRSKESRFDDFLISMITDESNKTIWNFKEEKFGGRGFLVLHKDLNEPIIVLENWGKITRVIPVIDLLKRKPVESANGEIIFVGGRTKGEMIDIKRYIAKHLKMTPIFSEEEQELINLQQRLMEQKRLAKEIEEKNRKEEERLAKEKIKQEKVEKIISRPEIKAISPDGKKLRGIPVEESEWEMLPSHSRAILVKNYGQDNMEILEAFFVERGRGKRPEKIFPKVALCDPEKKKDPVARAIGLLYLEINGQVEEVPLFSQNGLNNLQKSGLNGGTMVAVMGQTGDEQFKVVEFQSGEYKEVGYFVPLGEKYFTPCY